MTNQSENLNAGAPQEEQDKVITQPEELTPEQQARAAELRNLSQEQLVAEVLRAEELVTFGLQELEGAAAVSQENRRLQIEIAQLQEKAREAEPSVATPETVPQPPASNAELLVSDDEPEEVTPAATADLSQATVKSMPTENLTTATTGKDTKDTAVDDFPLLFPEDEPETEETVDNVDSEFPLPFPDAAATNTPPVENPSDRFAFDDVPDGKIRPTARQQDILNAAMYRGEIPNPAADAARADYFTDRLEGNHHDQHDDEHEEDDFVDSDFREAQDYIRENLRGVPLIREVRAAFLGRNKEKALKNADKLKARQNREDRRKAEKELKNKGINFDLDKALEMDALEMSPRETVTVNAYLNFIVKGGLGTSPRATALSERIRTQTGGLGLDDDTKLEPKAREYYYKVQDTLATVPADALVVYFDAVADKLVDQAVARETVVFLREKKHTNEFVSADWNQLDAFVKLTDQDKPVTSGRGLDVLAAAYDFAISELTAKQKKVNEGLLADHVPLTVEDNGRAFELLLELQKLEPEMPPAVKAYFLRNLQTLAKGDKQDYGN